MANFNAKEFDLIINAIGAGDPAKVNAMGAEILDVTDLWDRRILDDIPATTRYVFLSCGAVHGHLEHQQLDENALRHLVADGKIQPYTATKLIAERRHRAAPDRSILDLRIFGFSDQSISLGGTSFLADLARSVATDKELITSDSDMLRDYAGALELSELIGCWSDKAGGPNVALDLYTRAPVSKIDLIKLATARYGSQYTFPKELLQVQLA